VSSLLAPGTIVDRYTVEHPLGSGGMAWVYAVRHTVLDTRHALKVLHTYASHPSQHERLVREGRLQARLDPQHVVPVTDVVRVDGAPALVMPRIDGCALDQVLAVHRPAPDEALALFAGVVLGVCAAHRAGVVHRDLKPANVLLDVGLGDVRVRVGDFGVAKALASAAEAAEAAEATPAQGRPLDTVGFVGTPAYAAPEQRDDAAAVDALADLWSLGVILYELLVGRRPVIAEEVDVRAVPVAWRPLAATLLQVDPAARPASADAVAEALASVGVTGTPLRPDSAVAQIVRQCRDAAAAEAAEAARIRWAETRGGTTHAVPDTAATPSEALLPRIRDAFVGRRDTLALLRERLVAGALVTVTGMGGTGKTRLALQYARDDRRDRPGGTWFCDLSEARDVEGVVQAVGRALRVPLGTPEPVERLGHALAARGRCLLVLDNFEVVTAHAPQTLGRWLELAPEATFLVTSREVLGLRGEEVVPLEPLPVEDAAALFVQRASAALPGFEPSAEDLAAIEALAGMLDGLPLAIELAAARIRVLGPEQLLARMSDRFRVLAARQGSPSGSTAARHQTLRGTIDWSWELLSPRDRTALARLSVFEGPFDLDAAEAVLAPDPDDPDPPWTIDLLQGLVDRSLVRTLGRGRFTLLFSVREYARERLVAAGGEREAEERHGRHYAGFGTRAAVEALHRHGGTARRQRLQLDLDNLKAAHRRAVARGDAAIAADAADACWQVLLLTGPPGQAVTLIEQALELADAESGIDPRRRVQLLLSAGAARMSAADGRAALGHFEAAEAAEALGDEETLSHALAQQAVVHHIAGRLEVARPLYERVLERARVSRARGGIEARFLGMVLRNLGALLRSGGDPVGGMALEEEALAVHRASGDRRAEGIVLRNLGLACLGQWRLDEAEAHQLAALAAHRETGDRRMEAQVLGDLGVLLCVRGRMAEAIASGEAAVAAIRAVGDRRTEGQELCSLSNFLKMIGREEEAVAAIEASLALHRQLGTPTSVARALANLGTLRLGQDRIEEATACLEEARALAAQHHDPRQEAECRSYLAQVALRAGDEAGARAHLEAALAGARGVQQRQLEADVLGTLGGMARRGGDLDGARALLDEAEALVRRLGDPLALGHVLCERVRLDLAEGDGVRAEAAREEVRGIIEACGLLPAAPLARALAALD
jgi:predicted ATPase/tRNA A-37 threonylcarbamoyl transferase component Bud32